MNLFFKRKKERESVCVCVREREMKIIVSSKFPNLFPVPMFKNELDIM